MWCKLPVYKIIVWTTQSLKATKKNKKFLFHYFSYLIKRTKFSFQNPNSTNQESQQNTTSISNIGKCICFTFILVLILITTLFLTTFNTHLITKTSELTQEFFYNCQKYRIHYQSAHIIKQLCLSARNQNLQKETV